VKRFRRVFIEITNRCNLSCEFCAPSKRPAHFMTAEEFHSLAKQVAELAGMASLHVLGEPFMHPELPAILSVCSALSLPINLVTNGTLAKKFGHSLYNEPCLRQLSVSLHALACLTPENREAALSSLIGLARAKRRDLIISFRLRGNRGEPFREHIAREFFRAFGVEKAQAGLHGGIEMADNVFFQEGEFFSWPGTGSASGRKSCLGLRHHFGILCTGEVIPCCVAHDGVLALGNAFREPLSAILSGAKAQELRKKLSGRAAMPAYCAGCGFHAPESGAI